VDPEDVVLLAIAFELKSPRVGEWSRKGWVEGWKSLGCDSTDAMRACLPKLRTRLSADPAYFKNVYNYTFDFARTQGQRSLAIDTAIAFWSLLLPHGIKGKALSHVNSVTDSSSDDEDDDGDVSMENNSTIERGWKEEYNNWWFEFLTVKGGKGVSKDTWTMVRPPPLPPPLHLPRLISYKTN
jgi:DCN1-like protein 1/2